MSRWRRAAVAAIGMLVGAVMPCAAASAGADPVPVALGDRALWRGALDSPATYDRASRVEILVFAAVLADALEDAARNRTPALDRLGARLAGHLLANFRAAAASCGPADPSCAGADSVATLIRAGRDLIARTPASAPWLVETLDFSRRYLAELIRLATLFADVSSEIDTFGPLERTGFELPDGHFLLSFDDGPSTDESTETLSIALQRARLHAFFFVLGERLAPRAPAGALEALYRDQCVGLHGWQHVSHQKSDDWQQSVLATQRLVVQALPSQYRPYFRPPFGQRRPDSGAFFAAHGLGVVLWNIDSQDWRLELTADDAARRVLTLMLLWRRGVILFHDALPKAERAVPWLVNHTRHAGVTWDDCRRY